MPGLPLTSYPGEAPSVAVDYMENIRRLEAELDPATVGSPQTISYGSNGKSADTSDGPTVLDVTAGYVKKHPFQVALLVFTLGYFGREIFK